MTIRLLLGCAALTLLGGCPISRMPCESATAIACRCADGRAGVARCLADGEYESCFCATEADGGTSEAPLLRLDAPAPTDVPSVDAAVPDAARDAGPAPCIRGVDLLFEIDSSSSMVEEQALLAAELPRLLRVLTSGDRDDDGIRDFTPVASLHLGVITPDLGGGPDASLAIPSCPVGFGDDGLLQNTASGAGCAATYPSGIFAFEAASMDPDATATAFACVAQVGTGGCGFEQQLEAVLKALSPGLPTPWVASDYVPPTFAGFATPHGDAANAGFLRDGSLLAITVVTDEDDCSVPDYGLFSPASPRYSEPLNVRCSGHPEALHPLSRYASGYLQLRDDPRLVVFSAITGVPTDASGAHQPTEYDALLERSEMLETVSPDGMRILPACTTPETVAAPARRIVGLARELALHGARTSVGSICDRSYASDVDAIITAIVEGEPSCAP